MCHTICHKKRMIFFYPENIQRRSCFGQGKFMFLVWTSWEIKSFSKDKVFFVCKSLNEKGEIAKICFLWCDPNMRIPIKEVFQKNTFSGWQFQGLIRCFTKICFIAMALHLQVGKSGLKLLCVTRNIFQCLAFKYHFHIMSICSSFLSKKYV